jgi:hypothetical protein
MTMTPIDSTVPARRRPALAALLLALAWPASPDLPAAPRASAAVPSKPAATAPPAAGFRELKWDELVPKGWNPFSEFRLRQPGALNDADPRAAQMMQELRAALDAAPVVAALDGAAIRVPGYVVPLEESNGELREFLLVPYFGACIHTPPPPANQIILVKAPRGLRFKAMDTVWVNGTLRVSRADTAMGASGYRVDAVAVTPYTGPPGS